MTSFRVHVITGSTGIGAATAEQLVAAGDAVFIVSKTADHAEDLAARLSASGGTVAALATDVTAEAEVEAAVEACMERFGRIDGLLSVAGGSGRRFGDGPIDELTAEGWDQTIDLNLRSQALVSRAVIRRMLGRAEEPGDERGSVVLVSSVLAHHPVPELFATHAYAAAKGGIISLALTMAATYARNGIRVNVVAPGLTATPMARRASTDARTSDFVRRKQPLTSGLVEARDVAAAATFLLSPASRAITGQVLAVDGGWSIVSASPPDPTNQETSP